MDLASFNFDKHGKKLYAQKFRPLWKKDPRLKNWLEEVPSQPYRAFCKFCNITMQAKKSDLLAHFLSRRHHRSMEKSGAGVYNIFDNIIEKDGEDDEDDEADDDDEFEEEEYEQKFDPDEIENIDNVLYPMDDSSSSYVVEKLYEEDTVTETIEEIDEEDVHDGECIEQLLEENDEPCSFPKQELLENNQCISAKVIKLEEGVALNSPKTSNISETFNANDTQNAKPKSASQLIKQPQQRQKCRVCLDEYQIQKMTDIFSKDELELKNNFVSPSDVLKVSEKVEYCCGVRIDALPGLPTKICSKCYDMIRIWFNFRQVCVKSQLYLQAKLTKNNPLNAEQELEDDALYLESSLKNIQNFRLHARNKIGYDIDLVNALFTEYKSESLEHEPNDDAEEFVSEETSSCDVVNKSTNDDNDFDEEDYSQLKSREFALNNVAVEIEPETSYDTELDTQTSTIVAKTQIVAKRSKKQKHFANAYRPSSPESYMCSVCGNVYAKKASFMNHMATHSNVKPHECELCGKSFRQVAELKNHMRRHTGEKPYKCRYCERHFTDRSERHRHERTHTNDRPYVCKVCGKSFMYSAILRNHEKLHSGEKNYNCVVCNKFFTLHHHLKSHFLTLTHKQKEEQYLAAGLELAVQYKT